mmetsp:Transcript_31046/g.88984  ORF Transcript_31046/g.88984 Transcript_31046/m.88984 type:complete len:387 (+) Transcript_31046:143-1303(+)
MPTRAHATTVGATPAYQQCFCSPATAERDASEPLSSQPSMCKYPQQPCPPSLDLPILRFAPHSRNDLFSGQDRKYGMPCGIARRQGLQRFETLPVHGVADALLGRNWTRHLGEGPYGHHRGFDGPRHQQRGPVAVVTFGEVPEDPARHRLQVEVRWRVQHGADGGVDKPRPHRSRPELVRVCRDGPHGLHHLLPDPVAARVLAHDAGRKLDAPQLVEAGLVGLADAGGEGAPGLELEGGVVVVPPDRGHIHLHAASCIPPHPVFWRAVEEEADVSCLMHIRIFLKVLHGRNKQLHCARASSGVDDVQAPLAEACDAIRARPLHFFAERKAPHGLKNSIHPTGPDEEIYAVWICIAPLHEGPAASDLLFSTLQTHAHANDSHNLVDG